LKEQLLEIRGISFFYYKVQIIELIISSAALLAERKWGVTLTLVSLSMVISGMAPYSVVRLITLQDIYGIGGFTLLTTLLSTLALLYWCNPKHRRSIRL